MEFSRDLEENIKVDGITNVPPGYVGFGFRVSELGLARKIQNTSIVSCLFWKPTRSLPKKAYIHSPKHKRKLTG